MHMPLTSATKARLRERRAHPLQNAKLNLLRIRAVRRFHFH